MSYLVYYLWKSSLPWDYYITTSSGMRANADIEATTQDAFSHKDDPREMNLDPEDDEHGHVQGESSNYAPLSMEGEQHVQRHDHEQQHDHQQQQDYDSGTVPQGTPAARYDDMDESGYNAERHHPQLQHQQQQHHDGGQLDFPEGPYEEFGVGNRQIHGGSERGRGYNY